MSDAVVTGGAKTAKCGGDFYAGDHVVTRFGRGESAFVLSGPVRAADAGLVLLRGEHFVRLSPAERLLNVTALLATASEAA